MFDGAVLDDLQVLHGDASRQVESDFEILRTAWRQTEHVAWWLACDGRAQQRAAGDKHAAGVEAFPPRVG
jgi:hypothetical protein